MENPHLKHANTYTQHTNTLILEWKLRYRTISNSGKGCRTKKSKEPRHRRYRRKTLSYFPVPAISDMRNVPFFPEWVVETPLLLQMTTKRCDGVRFCRHHRTYVLLTITSAPDELRRQPLSSCPHWHTLSRCEGECRAAIVLDDATRRTMAPRGQRGAGRHMNERTKDYDINAIQL